MRELRIFAISYNLSSKTQSLIVGNMGAAKSALYLRKTELTHVLNSAEGTRIGTVNASQGGDSIDTLKIGYYKFGRHRMMQ